jgi:mono/diheme cytochrome c family protein
MKVSTRLLTGAGVALLGAALALPAISFAQSAKDIYAQKCVSCHGTSGKGDGPAGKFLKPPPQDFAKTLKGKTDAWIAKAIQEGGPAVKLAPTMPAYKDLTPAQVKELVEYIKKLG